MASGIYDGSTWQTPDAMHAFDGAAWQECDTCYIFDGSAWQEFFSASSCATGALTAVNVNQNQAGYCNGSICTSYIEFEVEWDYSVCTDACHHIEVWSKTSASSACTSVSWTKEVDNLSCDNDPADCTPGGAYDGCWLDDTLLDAYDYASGYYAYYCYQVRIVRDSDEGTDDSSFDYYYQKTLYCPIECGGGGNGPG